MRKNILFAFAFLLSAFAPMAQTVGELTKTAEKLEKEGHLYDAAVLFEKAWRIKPQQKEYAYRAGENYFFAKDYRKATDCLQAVKMETKDYPLVGLIHARSLKQDQRYREAMEAFTSFLRGFVGKDKKLLEEIIMNELQGCDLGLQLTDKTKAVKSDVQFTILPEGVNSVENEFAPIPITDDLLYFSSNFQGNAKIYRIMRQEGVWSRPELAKGLPKPVEQHFGNGCFSPDGARFYFTQCSAPKATERNSDNSRAICSIYLTRRTLEGNWTEPEKLRDYINVPGSTNTQPFVYEANGEEVIVFVSDREGGLGGLDLYQCSRPMTSPDMDFSLPFNLGTGINTMGDEISPFVEPETKALYFSSNGLVNMGGFDIYRVSLDQVADGVNHLGVPYNSAADDFGFVLKKSGNGGFLVSNRQALPQKVSTQHEDIFEFTTVSESLFLTAKAFDAVHQISLRNLDCVLYEKDSDGQLRLLTMETFAEGEIKFPIMKGKTYALEISKKGYQTATVETEKRFATNSGYQLSVSMQDKSVPVAATKASVSVPTPPIKSATSTIYYVQVEAVAQYSENEERYRMLSQFGTLKATKSPALGLYRVMVGPFSNKEQANNAARSLRESVAFPQAFVVRE